MILLAPTWFYPLKEKFEVASIFKSFHKMIQHQFHTNTQAFQSDN